MKNSISKEELENDLLFGTLQALHNCVSKLGLDLYIVGKEHNENDTECVPNHKIERVDN